MSLWRSCVILLIPPANWLSAQPALSSALRQIETVLGGKLVNRTASAVTLTELGNAILPHAQRVLSVAQLAFDDMQHIVQVGGEGTVRIGLIPSVSSLLFPLLPRTLAQAFPRLRVEFHDQTNDALVVQLLKGQIDFGIGALDNSVPDQLNVFPLQDDPFVAVIHSDDPLAASAHLPWKQLAGRDIAVFSKGNIQRLVAALAESHRLSLPDTLSGGLHRNFVRSGALETRRGDFTAALYHAPAGPAAQGGTSSTTGPGPHGGVNARPAAASSAYRILLYADGRHVANEMTRHFFTA